MKYIQIKQENRRVAQIAALCLALSLLALLMPLRASAEVYGSLLRFHVVANSDSVEDQEVKLAVRDLVLEWTREGLSSCENRAEAELYLETVREGLCRRVRDYLRQEGFSYGAEAMLAVEYHAPKTYEDITLPQGNYLSFRLVLGEGKGKNFFCVLFPPICKNTATEPASEVLIRYGVSPYGVQETQTAGTREVRFFLWESLQRIFDL